ncbi:MAG TPA: DUF1840 domain-containing protein [Gammaproteobacteria bacterium]|nr:DUF1840 domain-containing protein [Gammaproteobacteria bacterium]
MLVTFSCPAYADITMFGDVAVQLLKMMGHSGTVPGALDEGDVEAALHRLEAALDAGDQQPQQTEASTYDEDDDDAVSLSQRAWPLVELLEAAVKVKTYVMWDKKD